MNARAVFRTAWLVAYAFWQGGFTFYGGVVVPVGTRLLGSTTQQGFITQSVTNYLNLAGLVALALWFLELYLLERWRGEEPTRHEAFARWLLWWGLAIALAAQFALHARMDGLLDAVSYEVRDPWQFHWLHRAYLMTSTGQWLAGVILLALSTAGSRKPRATGGIP